MLKSLEENTKDYHVYVFGFDDDTYNVLKKLALPNVTPISMQEFEGEELLKIKKERTLQEYCWTCTSFSISYVISKYNPSQITYIDSDLFFFSDPIRLLEEMGSSSVLLTDHRYTKKYDQSEESGRYCVQFLSFKNDESGMEALHWWRDRCAEWCFARHEDGKFGDQKYLDDWTTRFKRVHVLRHLGGGIAPWNSQQYDFFEENGKLSGREIETNESFPVVFHHFHDFKFPDEGAWGHSGDYYLKFDVYQFIYKKYLLKLLELNSICKEVKSDLIKLPKIVSKYEWEKLYLPKLSKADREYFRSIYQSHHSNFVLNDDFDRMDVSAIRKLIQFDFRLEQGYNDYQKIQELVSEPNELADLWNQKIARTSLYLEKENGYDWNNYISTNVNSSSEMKSFEIKFEIRESLKGFLWMPMWKNSCAVRIRTVFHQNGGNKVEIALKPDHTNGIYKEDVLYFFHSHATLQWERLSLSEGSIVISGEWKSLNTWDAYLGIRGLLESHGSKSELSIHGLMVRFKSKLVNLYRRLVGK
ncbi:hypothetical protein [Leptospira kobayashii]|nr:hypothetical protein [Leptospira kobayashii]